MKQGWMGRRAWLQAAAGVVGAAGAPAVWSGQDCGEKPAATPEKLAVGAALGARVVARLEESGASLALVARIGLDLSEFGQRHTHLGVAWRDAARNRWMMLHLLNACGGNTSELLEQPAQKFYEVDLFIPEAVVAVPAYSLQVKLLRAFLGPLGRRLHEPRYNLIAHPFNTQFQNSNQWILEVLAAALMDAPPASRAEVQRWMQASRYEPGSIRIPNLRRSAARLFSPHVHFTDHTQQEYEQQRYQVVTVDSVLAFLRTQDAQLVQGVVT